MSNINLILNLSKDSKLSNTLYKEINNNSNNYVNKHAPLKNEGCNKCWLNAAFQMLAYIGDFVSQITTYTDSSNINDEYKEVNKNYKKLFTNLMNPSGAISTINYGDSITKPKDVTSDFPYGNLYLHAMNLFIDIGIDHEQMDSAEGLSYLLNYFMQNAKLNFENIKYTEKTTRTCNVNKLNATCSCIDNCIYILPVPKNNLMELSRHLKERLELKINITDQKMYKEGCKEKVFDDASKKGPYTETIDIFANKYFIIKLNVGKQGPERDHTGKLLESKQKTNLIISKSINLNNYEYLLSGFIMHQGPSLNVGHYIFYKILPDGRGIEYNDSNIYNITIDEMNDLLSKDDINNTPYVLLYEKKALTCSICSVGADMSIYKLKDDKTDLINNLIEFEKLKCYSINLKNDTYKDKIYESFNNNLLINENNIIYLQINISAQNKENFKLLITTLYYHIFKKNIKELINIPDNFKIKLMENNNINSINILKNFKSNKDLSVLNLDSIDFSVLFFSENLFY